jgi:rod shape-determining protein MreC
MRLHRHETLARPGSSVRRLVRRPAVTFALVFVSLALLFLSRLQHAQVTGLRLQLAELMAPALKAALVPLEPVRRVRLQVARFLEQATELDRLRVENERLNAWEWRARELERKVEQLEDLARVVAAPAVPFVTTRIVADSSGPFVQSAMLGIGRDNGMKTGFPVINRSGLVGRLVETGARVSRVLLVTDISSRIPVQIGPTRREPIQSGPVRPEQATTRAILAGDNGPLPKLNHMEADARIEIGDEVFTSGLGGMFPRGQRIGRVVHDGVGFRVKPHAQLSDLDFVSVLLFESLAANIGDKATRADGDKLTRTRDGVARRSAVSGADSEQKVRMP